MPLPTFQGRGTLFLGAGTSGWSESYYLPGIDYTSCIANLNFIIDARLDILQADCGLLYAYVSNVAVRGDALPVTTVARPGTFTDATGFTPLDYCLLMTWTVGVLSRNRTFLHGLPLSQQIDGLFTPTGPFSTKLSAYETTVVGNAQFRQRTNNPTPPPPFLYTYLAPSFGVPDVRLARRKVGRPFGLPRGRRLAPA